MKYLVIFYFVLGCISLVKSNWAQSARFVNFREYFPRLLQETVYELEKYGWHNFKLNDQTNNINQEIYDRTFQGQVNYTNGFLASVLMLDATDLRQSFLQGVVDYTITGTMACDFHLHEAMLGYDVSADLGAEGRHVMTGLMRHEEIKFRIQILKNFNTSVITSVAGLSGLSAQVGVVMEYLPESDIGEVLSRHYLPSSTWNAVAFWGREIVAPAISRVIDTIGFPEICFSCD